MSFRASRASLDSDFIPDSSLGTAEFEAEEIYPADPNPFLYDNEMYYNKKHKSFWKMLILVILVILLLWLIWMWVRSHSHKNTRELNEWQKYMGMAAVAARGKNIGGMNYNANNNLNYSTASTPASCASCSAGICPKFIRRNTAAEAAEPLVASANPYTAALDCDNLQPYAVGS